MPGNGQPKNEATVVRVTYGLYGVDDQVAK